MNNPVYQMLNSNSLMNKFEAFKSNFQGDPKDEVQRLLDSGRMSQEQFNRLAEQATELHKLFRL